MTTTAQGTGPSSAESAWRTVLRPDGAAGRTSASGVSDTLFDRRAFVARGQQWLSRPASRGAMLLLDIDHFDRINEHMGRAAADQVIAALTGVLTEVVALPSIVARIAREAFAILLPDRGISDAAELAGDLLGEIRQLRVAIGAGADTELIHVTASIGFSASAAVSTAFDPLLCQADAALQAARRAGGNRAIAHLPDTEPPAAPGYARRTARSDGPSPATSGLTGSAA